MAEIINLDDYRTDCRNCLYHAEGGVCTCPGGWEMDKNLTRCLSFRRRNGRPGIRKEGEDHADNGNHCGRT